MAQCRPYDTVRSFSPDRRLIPRLFVLTDTGTTRYIAGIAEIAGFHLSSSSGLSQAQAPIEFPSDCDVILLSCVMSDPRFEKTLVEVERFAIQRNLPVIVITSAGNLGLAKERICHERTQLLCDPSADELRDALASVQIHDVQAPKARGQGNKENSLQRLSDDLSRLARSVEKLTEEQRRAAPSFDLGPRISDRPSDYIGLPASPHDEESEGAVTAQEVRDLLRARRLRDEFLPGDLFADPAWDMLLDLFAARLEQERVSVSSLCIASEVPPTTALRWLRMLTDNGLLERHADPYDGRRTFVALNDSAAEALTSWFQASRRFLNR